MRRHHVFVLAVVALVAIAATFWAGSVREPNGTREGNMALVPGLSSKLNDVTTLRIRGKDNRAVTLARGEQAWAVAEKDGYPADKGKIAKFLIALGDARLTEEKTSNPDQYAQLGVGDPQGGEGAGTRVDIELPSGDRETSLIVGKAARGSTATYVRRVDDAGSWLASGNLAVEDDPLSWLEREIVNLPANRVQSVTIRHPDGRALTIEKNARDEANFTVRDLQEGAALKYDSVANPVGSALAGLRLEDVSSRDSGSADENAVVQAAFRRFDGLVVTATVFERDGGHYGSFNASFDEDQARRDWEQSAQSLQEAAAAESGGEGDGGGGEAAMPELAPPDFSAVQEEVAALETRLSPWLFKFSSYKYEQMTRTNDDLLKEETDEE